MNKSPLEKPDPARKYPPGRIKIAEALRRLLTDKDFNAVTTAEIARTAGVTEGLIYKYFKDKRDLLYQVLAEHLEQYIVQVRNELNDIEGALGKLKKCIRAHLHVYATDRAFARTLLFEVRSYQDYYSSRTYDLVRDYCGILHDIVCEGLEKGEIRRDLDPVFVRNVIIGAIEQVSLGRIAFQREIDPDALTEDICRTLFGGLAATPPEGMEK